MNELKHRTSNLKPEYEVRAMPEHGTGLYPVHIETGKVCNCKMKWNVAGTVLYCPKCGFDGT
jgi:hypothetical protein